MAHVGGRLEKRREVVVAVARRFEFLYSLLDNSVDLYTYVQMLA
jgi:hypothetical protein